MKFESCACGMEPPAVPLQNIVGKAAWYWWGWRGVLPKEKPWQDSFLFFLLPLHASLHPPLTVEPGTIHPDLWVLLFSLKIESIELNF